MHKLGPDAPTISKNQVIWMKTQKMAAYLASPPLKVRPPLAEPEQAYYRAQTSWCQSYPEDQLPEQ